MTRAAKYALGIFLTLSLGLLALGLGPVPGGEADGATGSDLKANLLYLDYLRAAPPAWQGLDTAATGRILALASAQMGRAYRSGGVTPAGFDCSGFTSWVYGKAGVSLPRTSAEQSRFGRDVTARGLSPGDLVFFGRGGRVGHVGIYLSGDTFIHSSGPAGRVAVDSLRTPYWSAAYAGAKRVLAPGAEPIQAARQAAR